MTAGDAREVAIVTGAGRGIGRATARRLAADGFYLVVCDTASDTAASTAHEITSAGGAAESSVLDVTDRERVSAVFADITTRLGRIDAVVNNAMWVRYESVLDVDEVMVDGMFAVGFKAALWTIQAALPAMTAQGRGSIVNLSSPAAVRGVPGSSIYSAVKGAISSLTWQLAGELGPSGIRINAVVPGAVPTEGARQAVDDAGYELRRARTPLGRLGTPDDIAAAVSFLVSSDADFVTGHLLVADGGLLAS